MASKVFSKRLQQLRLEKGISQREMSEGLGMSKNYIYNIESGYTYPSMTMFFGICEYLDVDPYEFICFEPVTTEKERELLDLVDGWTPEKMDRLIVLAKEL